jgi:hypothetical protein
MVAGTFFLQHLVDGVYKSIQGKEVIDKDVGGAPLLGLRHAVF